MYKMNNNILINSINKVLINNIILIIIKNQNNQILEMKMEIIFHSIKNIKWNLLFKIKIDEVYFSLYKSISNII